jgi:HPt (histidine-containing phosphotransfer) domain-containing protein
MSVDNKAMFDLEDVRKRMGGDDQLLLDIIRLFLDDAPKRLTALKAAVDAGDARQIRSEAHGLKGAAANLSASRVVEAAAVLEQFVGEGDAAPAWARVASETAALLAALRQFEQTQAL